MSTGRSDTRLPSVLGPQEFTAEEGAYTGSTFQEVRDALFANPYYPVWGSAGAPALPRYEVTLWSVLRGALSFGSRYPFFQAARRTVDSGADLRWGPDRRGFRRLLHPNGVCLTGSWEITEPTDYTGYFRRGSKGLVIARYSSGGALTRAGSRSLAMVGKVYPTTDPRCTRRVRPAAFITQQDFGGGPTAYINDVELRNAPDTHAWRRGFSGLMLLLVTGVVFKIADVQPTFRQLYEIAELEKPDDEPTRSPEFLRLLVAAGQPRVDGEGLDFRDEILAQLYDRGDPQPKRELAFDIEVSDQGTTRGWGLYQRRTVTEWRRIGRMVCGEAVASHNADCVIHIHHPAWRTDRNNLSSRARPERVH